MTDLKLMFRTSFIGAAHLALASTAVLAGGTDTPGYLRIDQGADLAGLWCNACHVVSDQPQETGQDAAPPFAVLAPLVKANPNRYRAFLENPHSPMREIVLSRDEIDALVAYIQSQDPGE